MTRLFVRSRAVQEATETPVQTVHPGMAWLPFIGLPQLANDVGLP